MHEGAVCREILLIAERAARQNDIRDITGITLAVGTQSCVNPAQLQFFFEIAKQNTRAEHAVLTIEPDDTITGPRQEFVRAIEGD
ncbi:hydrogenase maturation nickel metallochaperone HypA [Butyricicoccus sp.]|uniref:hydrogenase maturation nickel metallochaperone HypA/HybF n=1 Tax=Butyricicoccus sp. TaxID=2049021 RepID=UPI0037365EB1